MSTFVLDSTTKTIKVAMSGAAATSNPDFISTYADTNGVSFTEASSDGSLNGITDVSVVTAPSSGFRRVIKRISIENKDTAAVTITVKYDNNGTQRTIAKVTLQIGDTWTTDGTFDTYGSLKQTLGTVDLTSVTGTLAVANGGTGITSLGTGVATWLGTPTSANLRGAVTDETGSGSLVFATSPTLVTPVLGVATATSINKMAITAPATSSTLAVADGKTFTVSNTLTLTGTDTSSIAFGTGGTVAYTGGTLAQFSATTSSQLAGIISDETGSGALVFGTSPTINNQTVTNYTESVVAIGNSGTSQVLSLTNGTLQTVTMTGNCTFTMPTATAGKSFTLIVSTGAGSFTGAFTGVKWPAGSAPTLTTTASRWDILSFFSDGTNWYGTFAQNFS